MRRSMRTPAWCSAAAPDKQCWQCSSERACVARRCAPAQPHPPCGGRGSLAGQRARTDVGVQLHHDQQVPGVLKVAQQSPIQHSPPFVLRAEAALERTHLLMCRLQVPLPLIIIAHVLGRVGGPDGLLGPSLRTRSCWHQSHCCWDQSIRRSNCTHAQRSHVHSLIAAEVRHSSCTLPWCSAPPRRQTPAQTHSAWRGQPGYTGLPGSRAAGQPGGRWPGAGQPCGRGKTH